MEEPTRLTGKKAKALEALLDGSNVQDAALAAGVNRKTLGRWLSYDMEFWRAYQRHSQSSLQLAARRLANKLDMAVDMLASVMEDDEAPASLRLRAAQQVIDGSLRLLEAADFAERLTSLEARLDHV